LGKKNGKKNPRKCRDYVGKLNSRYQKGAGKCREYVGKLDRFIKAINEEDIDAQAGITQPVLYVHKTE